MPIHASARSAGFGKIPEINPSPREWNDPYEYIQNLHKWYGSEYGCVKVIPPACWSPAHSPWKRDAPKFRPKIQSLSLLNGENRQELAFAARVRVARFLSGTPLPRCDPSLLTSSGTRFVLKVRKLHTLMESYGIKLESAVGEEVRSAMREAIRECCDGELTDQVIDSVFEEVVSILHQWSIPDEPTPSFQHLSIVPSPLASRDRLNGGEFWTYTPRDDQVYLTRILNGGMVKKPTNGLPYVDIAIINPATGLSCISRMDEEDIDMYLANGHSRESARLATKCLLCEVCLGACGFPVDPEDLVIPDHKRPLPQASLDELKNLQSANPALMCSGCGITVHVDCLGKDRSFIDKAALHYMARTETDWFCVSCIPPKFPRNAAHAVQFGYQYTDKLMSRKEYEKRSDQKKSELGVTLKTGLEEIELKFWNTIAKKDSDIQVLYASDLDSGDFSDGPFFEDKPSTPPSWDLRRLSLSSESVLRHLPGAETITGVSRPWLYLGSFFSSFCWHSEDHFLCSISYLHEGAPKVWYTIPGEYRARMDQVMSLLLPDLYSVNRDLSHHLVTLIDPEILVKNFGIPVGRVVQNPGEFIITFPEAFHCGFNAGTNLAEAVNVACPDWFINHAKKSVDHYTIMKRPSVFCFDSLVWQTALAIVKGVELRKSVGEYCLEYLGDVKKKLERLDTGMIGGSFQGDIQVCEDCKQFCYFASRVDDNGKYLCLDCEGSSSGRIWINHSPKEIETLIEKVSSRIAQYRTVRRSNRAAESALAKRTRRSEL